MSSVEVYSAPWCGGCKVVKKALEKAGVQFVEIDITTLEGGLKAKELDIKSIPVTITPTGVQFIGSKPETIKEILETIGD